MKRILTLSAGLSVLLAISASAQSIFDGYAYVSDTTAGIDATWYDLGGSAQAQDFDGSDLGDFESALWLGGQTGFWSDGQGVEDITMHYSITGDASASGTIDYGFQIYSDPNDQWGTDVNGAVLSDASVDLISTHSLGIGDYNLAVWVEGKANNRDAIYDSNGGGNYTANFTIIPEPATMGLFAVVGVATLFIRRVFMM